MRIKDTKERAKRIKKNQKESTREARDCHPKGDESILDTNFVSFICTTFRC